MVLNLSLTTRPTVPFYCCCQTCLPTNPIWTSVHSEHKNPTWCSHQNTAALLEVRQRSYGSNTKWLWGRTGNCHIASLLLPFNSAGCLYVLHTDSTAGRQTGRLTDYVCTSKRGTRDQRSATSNRDRDIQTPAWLAAGTAEDRREKPAQIQHVASD